MKSLRLLALAALLLATACAGSRAYQEAKEEETLGHWDLAVLKYTRALELDPNNAHYKIALLQTKRRASQAHFEKGKLYRTAGQPEMAVVELEQPFLLDSTNKYAETELRKAKDDAAKAAAERSGETQMEAAK